MLFIKYIISKMSTTNIYILKLKNNKYYIGKTNDVNKRFQQHVSGTGSSWTSTHEPIKILKVIENASQFDEDKYVKEYMNKYGIDNVRGGAYVSNELDEVQKYSLQKEIWGANDLCTQCGRKGHFVKDCYAKKDVNGDDIYEEEKEEEVWVCNYCEKEFEDENDCEKHEKYCKSKSNKKKNACYRCGRSGHYSDNCYAKTDKDGYQLEDDSDDDSD